jgi:hypothetical protein
LVCWSCPYLDLRFALRLLEPSGARRLSAQGAGINLAVLADALQRIAGECVLDPTIVGA